MGLKILAAIGIIFAIVRLRTEVLRKREIALEQEIKLRTAELLEANEQLVLLATRDSLTGILNRRFFIEKAEAEIERMKRFPGKFTLLLLDVDHFKNVNDTYGHAAGDEILRAVAQQLSAELRVNDLVARHGAKNLFCYCRRLL
jgi:two-component system, cell cycle response regulator